MPRTMTALLLFLNSVKGFSFILPIRMRGIAKSDELHNLGKLCHGKSEIRDHTIGHWLYVHQNFTIDRYMSLHNLNNYPH